MVNLTDQEAAELKAWVIKKLENISDADSDVLADYVLALIRAETPEAELRASAIESLEDFLKDHTVAFVHDVFAAIHARSYLPGYVAPALQPIPTVSSESTRAAATRGIDGQGTQSRKRSHREANEGSNGDGHHRNGDRQQKQMKRGGSQKMGRGSVRENGLDFRNGFDMQGFPGTGGLPGRFDPNNPMAAMMAMQAVGMQMPGMHPAMMNQTSNGRKKGAQRCRDYDTKGICTRGINCPYNHGDNQIIIPPNGQASEYDPKSPSLMGFPNQVPSADRPPWSPNTSRGRARGRGDRNGSQDLRRGGRAEFSKSGPSNDRSNTTIVVEQIPEENMSEGSVRGFFTNFGAVDQVTLQPRKRLALVKFTTYDFAKAAYESPKVIFDNRFVKVYWYKQEPASTPAAGASTSTATPDQPEFDREKFERDSADAQKRLEERQALQKHNADKLMEIQKQQDELLSKQAEAQRQLEEKLRAKGHSASDTPDGSEVTGSAKDTRIQALKAQLEGLKNQAKSMNIESDPQKIASMRGRGAYRGRGSSRGWPPSRGSYRASSTFRGRGSFRGVPRGGAYNLDNRPKSVKVEGVIFDNEKEEALKQYLFSVGEFTSMEPAEDNSTQTITFKDRRTAEAFYKGSSEVPGVGKLEFSWVQTPVPAISNGSLAIIDDDTAMEGATVGDEDGIGNQQGEEIHPETNEVQKDMDYDVADVDDWVT